MIKAGGLAIPLQFDAVGTFSDGLAEVKVGNKWGYINKTGKYVIGPQFDYVMGFHEELAAVRIGKKWGYVDKTGKVVIPLQFDAAQNFSGGLAEVRVGERWVFIDKTGKYVRFSDSREKRRKKRHQEKQWISEAPRPQTFYVKLFFRTGQKLL